MRAVIVIPSRFDSTRFPGKPLEVIAGRSLISRVWSIASAVRDVGRVVVATDDARIRDHMQSIGAEVVMTAAECRNGTERVFEAVSQLDITPEIIINLQGDAALTPPWFISAVIDALSSDPDLQMATPAIKLSRRDYNRMKAEKSRGSSTGTFVTFDRSGNALYFSKALIPHLRDPEDEKEPEVYQHIGLYGYRSETLKKYLQLAEGRFEQTEKLEQLRALENGIPIKVVVVDSKGRTLASVDNPGDIAVVEEIIASEGELVG